MKDRKAWVAILAGGGIRDHFDAASRMVIPIFNDHDACRLYWDHRFRCHGELSAWGICEVPLERIIDAATGMYRKTIVDHTIDKPAQQCNERTI